MADNSSRNGNNHDAVVVNVRDDIAIDVSVPLWQKVPPYIVAQVIGSLLASGTLRLVFEGKESQFIGTIPSGSDLQAFVIEFIITFYLMFVVSGVATDNRAVSFLSQNYS
ncbi:unnamed protein product [Lupinus luteus]|uniref:Uncharacterized protein n=1 Tax=Lupinus luteus TaxID=3873 RepID=A0AAV1WI63_LUPLU